MSTQLARRLGALSAAVDRACSLFAFLALGIMLLAVLLQIVARYVFDAPPPWTEEIGRYAMLWSGLLGGTMAYYRRADPALVQPRATDSAARVLLRQSVEFVALVVFVAPVLQFTPGFLERHAHPITETLEINSALVVAIVPVSLVVLLVHQAARVAGALESLRAGRSA